MIDAGFTYRAAVVCLGGVLWLAGCAEAPRAADQRDNPLRLPLPGEVSLRVLNPRILELTGITLKAPDPARLKEWNVTDRAGRLNLPPASRFTVTASGGPVKVTEIGFKRRAIYAPLKQRDLRVRNDLYLVLDRSLADGETVKLSLSDPLLQVKQVGATVDPLRVSPVLHVNQTGYLPSQPKRALAGYYLGSLGEMDITDSKGAVPSFTILSQSSGEEVFKGELRARKERGYEGQSYQKVYEADFSELNKPGEYRLQVPGLGTSYTFRIDEGTAAALARTYALGLYHQRCGTDNSLPYTRFTHGPCHTAAVKVPTMSAAYEAVNASLEKESSNYKDDPRHKAPQLKSVAASLYPFVNKGPLDLAGGHHDAGDYSKYTINSAGFIHHLVFAVDCFPGVAGLDNLGLPESGDGNSDVLQEVKWEADFLAKMQDGDGGFYFLVYPEGREYEDNVLPDRGDPQIVFPKNTAVTAAATAALAQCASSPTFKKQFPEAAALYLEKARQGWNFLERALEKHGWDGSYQKITHYGDEFLHDDEIVWAATELFIATGEPKYDRILRERLKPADPNTRKWGWWRLFDAWGCAIRSYAFAERAGKIGKGKLNQSLLRECEDELSAAGLDQLKRAQESAYGTSLPDETKRARSAGWYFAADPAFDLAVASQLGYPERNDPRPAMLDAILSNLNYELGCNPVNVTYLTGLGTRRQREIVHQYAQNDRRMLPPSGIPLGNIQGGMAWLHVYNKEPAELSFPADGADRDFYPFYDRWSDAFNLMQEFVILHQARGLGVTAWLMAQTSLAGQKWRPVKGEISEKQNGGDSTYQLSAPGLDLSNARTVWEAESMEPRFSKSLVLHGKRRGWIEAEAQLPDGRRVFGVWEGR